MRNYFCSQWKVLLVHQGWPASPGVLDNNPEQIRNKLKIAAYALETT